MEVLNEIMLVTEDPLPNLHRQTREARRNALMENLHSALANAYTLAHDDFIWTFRRAMLMLSGRKDVSAARDIWTLKDACEMKEYWNDHIAYSRRIPKFEDLIDHWFCQNGNPQLSIIWSDDVRDALDVGLNTAGLRIDQWYLDHTPTIVKAADIIAAFVKQHLNRNLYVRHKDFPYLESPPPKQDVVIEIDSL